MIIVEMGGGLGNQMFIYATGLLLSRYHKTQLKLDISCYDTWPKKGKFARNFYLDKFNISAKIATKQEIMKFMLKTKFRYINWIFKRFHLFEKNVYEENTKKFPPSLFNLPNNIFLRIYFGDKLFAYLKEDPKFCNILKKEFTLKEKYKNRIMNFLKEITQKNSVGMHVRRGDLLTIKNAYVLPISYYQTAMSFFKDEKIHLYIFSDDIEWCENNMQFDIPTTYVKGLEVYEDFELMRNCKHIIVSNSALSWWAAFLKQNSNGKVIVPKCFTHYPKQKSRLPVLEEWIEI
ncbi:MAG: alpha-1,2-fucosyltransferase [Candidatus Pacearchaeota archaeon]